MHARTHTYIHIKLKLGILDRHSHPSFEQKKKWFCFLSEKDILRETHDGANTHLLL